MYCIVLLIQLTHTSMSNNANTDVSNNANTDVSNNANTDVSNNANTDVSNNANTDVSNNANTDVSNNANTDMSNNANTDVICSICYDIILPVQVIQTPCKNLHTFHKECFVKFRKHSNYNNTCPYCRADVKLQQMIPKGTCKRLKESHPILEDEKAKLIKLIDENRIVEKTIKKIIFRLNIDISHISKTEMTVEYKKSKSFNFRQLEWRIEQKKIKQIVETKSHKKYLQELFKVIDENTLDGFYIPYVETQKNRIDNM